MGCTGQSLRKIASLVMAVLQVVVAAVIVYLIADRLYSVNYTTAASGTQESATCLLDRDTQKKDNFCVIGFGAVGITFAVMLALTVVQVCMTGLT
jgi:hypothetical protein